MFIYGYVKDKDGHEFRVTHALKTEGNGNAAAANFNVPMEIIQEALSKIILNPEKTHTYTVRVSVEQISDVQRCTPEEISWVPLKGFNGRLVPVFYANEERELKKTNKVTLSFAVFKNSNDLRLTACYYGEPTPKFGNKKFWSTHAFWR